MHLDVVDKWWTCHIFVTAGGGQLSVLSQFCYSRWWTIVDPVTISLQRGGQVVDLSQFRYSVWWTIVDPVTILLQQWWTIVGLVTISLQTLVDKWRTCHNFVTAVGGQVLGARQLCFKPPKGPLAVSTGWT